MKQRNSHDQLLPLRDRLTSAQQVARKERIAARVGKPRRQPIDFRRRVPVPTLTQAIVAKIKRDWS